MPIYKPAGRTGKDDPWYALYKDHNDNWKRKSTGLTDKKLAEAKLLEFQRRASDPNGETQNAATLADALKLLLKERASQVKAGLRSQDTLEYYQKKCGVLQAVLGEDLLAKNITAGLVDNYIRQRREGVCENSISKEIGAWRSAMKLAKRAGLWAGDMSVFPIAFAPEYDPRTRWMTEAEIEKYRAVMPPDKFAIMAFSIATSAEWSALWRATPEDIAKDFKSCRVRGSKNDNRDREIPILLPAAQRLLKLAKELAHGGGFLLFRYEHNFRRDLNLATAKVYPCKCEKRRCKACVSVRLSPNDLRRTHGKWLRLAGISNDDAAPMMGHADGRMMARVYGKMTAMELAPQLRKQLEKNRSRS